jgi:hypothetical protein
MSGTNKEFKQALEMTTQEVLESKVIVNKVKIRI